MGLVGSKDESGKVILGSLPPGFLDYKGRDLRDKLDICLAKNMWFFSIGGILISFPICVKYKTERPLVAAAISCPVLDMMYGTIRCDKEKEEFAQYYKQLQSTWNEKAGRHDPLAASSAAADTAAANTAAEAAAYVRSQQQAQPRKPA